MEFQRQSLRDRQRSVFAEIKDLRSAARSTPMDVPPGTRSSSGSLRIARRHDRRGCRGTVGTCARSTDRIELHVGGDYVEHRFVGHQHGAALTKAPAHGKRMRSMAYDHRRRVRRRRNRCSNNGCGACLLLLVEHGQKALDDLQTRVAGDRIEGRTAGQALRQTDKAARWMLIGQVAADATQGILVLDQHRRIRQHHERPFDVPASTCRSVC